MNNLYDIVNNNLCLGCGLCSINHSSNDLPVKMKYNSPKGLVTPLIYKNIKSENYDIGFEVCPAKGYKIKSLANHYSIEEKFYNKDLGYYYLLNTVTINNKELLSNASSSGITTLIANYLLENRIVDKVIATKFIYTEKGPRAKTFITNNYLDLIDAQGSKYCPVDLSEVLSELKINSDNKFLFIGTPCQIAGLRYIQKNIENLNIEFFIGNFCGGFKSYNNLDRLIKLNRFDLRKVQYFRFRGGGQPGSMKIASDAKSIEIPYPEYVKMTGYSKLKRCHFCVDATAELADLSCGDAWLKEYLETKEPTSIVISRNKRISEILNSLSELKIIDLNPISESKVIESQKGNISSKKYRQKGRIVFYKLLRIKLPEIEEGFYDGNYSLITEFNVFLGHKIKFMFEKLGLYYLIYYKYYLLRKTFSKLFNDIYD